MEAALEQASFHLALRACPNIGQCVPLRILTAQQSQEDRMRKLLLLAAATAAFLTVVVMPTPRAEATMSTAPASIQIDVGKASLVEQAAVACTHRRVCRQGAGCAWKKVCKRW